MKIRGARESAAAAFAACAEEYDRWHEDNPVYELELAALSMLAPPSATPAVEIGCGTGRFSRAAGIGLGIDPATACLAAAAARVPLTVAARAEELPVASGAAGAVFFFFSLCFCENKKKAVLEAARILRRGGGLTVAFINRESPWGMEIEKKGAAGHPLYRFARLMSPENVQMLLAAAGFKTAAAVSCLVDRNSPQPGERPQRGIAPNAGCVMITAAKE